ncbi:MAG: hypothetical protein K0A99_11710 [Desulfoarculaceae bacterium]|nr:hypothetical protein [Desulfoarculaceae bacterium]
MFALHQQWFKKLFLAFLPLVFLISGCVSTQSGTVASANIQENVFTVKGKVQKISPEKGVLIVSPAKGDRVTLNFTEQTPVKGGSIADIVRFHPVQVSYAVEDGQNVSVSIEILPQGSCN